MFPINPFPLIDESRFVDLKTSAIKYLLSNPREVSIIMNKSGFYRVYFPLPDDLTDYIEKVRINYWPQNITPEWAEENRIHSHPSPFDSFIIKGGYVHTIYQTDNNVSLSSHEHYILGKYNRTLFRFSGTQLHLNEVKTEMVEGPQVVHYSNQLLHDVIFSKPGTCTLNAVHKLPNKTSSSFDVYIPLGVDEEDVVVKESYLTEEKTILITGEILDCLQSNIEIEI
ncbi:MAG: hypothetical protein HRU36_01330 [Rickettsiales bacterium]|nr:hypothetical protein [Rickettsiales bacterium]